MKYERLIISNYRGIAGPLEIDIHRNPLIPIIGVNECGKTTILQAIVAFDYVNDRFSDVSIGHLQDVENLFSTAPRTPTITAEISVSRTELRPLLDTLLKDEENPPDEALDRFVRRPSYPLNDVLLIRRDLKSMKYSLVDFAPSLSADNQDKIARRVISWMPYILYFDDFRDKIPADIEITPSYETGSEWLQMLETLFQRTDRNFSVFTLAGKEDRLQKTILSRVNKKLSETLTRQWTNFKLDESDALSVRIYFETRNEAGTVRNYLKLDVVEKDPLGNEHFFFIRNRSKGFYWFFNFVMKLEFNPKVATEDGIDAIYLLDEPGSYLHASAQEQLCKKLRQLSLNNRVIFCTHSHHLLDPRTIPFAAVRVAQKDRDGQITLHRITEFRSDDRETRAAFQPLYDALQIRPFAADVDASELIVLTEGIIDYFLLESLKGTRQLRVLPSVGADSMKYYISFLIAWRSQFKALWDSDSAGRAAAANAEEHFGSEIASRHFRTLSEDPSKTVTIQHLLEGDDIVLARKQLDLPNNASFDKTMTALFYSERKQDIISTFTQRTKDNFAALYAKLEA